MAEAETPGKALVTLVGVAAAFVVGNFIPALGFLSWPTDPQSQQQILRINIFSAGFTGWTTAWALFQIYEMVKHWISSKNQPVMPVANPLDIKVLITALAMSGVIWWGLLQSVSQILLQTEITTPQVMIGLVTGLAGTGLLFFLARCLNRIWPGYGFWGLFAFASFYGFANAIPSSLHFLATGAISPQMLAFSALVFVVTLLAAILLMSPQRRSAAVTTHHIFAILILTAVASPFLAAPVFYLAQDILPQLNEILPGFAKGQAFQLLLVMGSILLTLIFLFLFSAKSSRNANIGPTFLIIASIYAVQELNFMLGGLPGVQIPIVALAYLGLCAHQAYKAMPKPPATPEEEDTSAFDADFRRGWRS